jgi:hypothetical protein
MTKKLEHQILECPAAAIIIRACQKFAEHDDGSDSRQMVEFMMQSLLCYVRDLVDFAMSCKRR